MDGSPLIMLGYFVSVINIRDIHEWFIFYRVDEMDGPLSIMLDYFVSASKSEGM